MIEQFLPYIFFIGLVVFLISVIFHLLKKYSWLIVAYSLQSLAIVSLLILLGIERDIPTLFFAAALTAVVKVIFAPAFFFRMIRKNKLRFAPAPYLSKWLSLVTILILTGFTFSTAFTEITAFFPANPRLIAVGIAAMLSALFLVVNRKDALSQIIGMLSFENAIVFISSLIGIEHTTILELGITFDLVVWIIIATVFVTVIYKQFGSVHVSEMTKLKE